jgi:hypothetical protein
MDSMAKVVVVMTEELERIELAVETIAVELERLGEHHRFYAQRMMNRPDAVLPWVNTPY